jgi:hypothetical protein
MSRTITKKHINFLYNSKTVWWSTAHAGSRATGIFLMEFDDICYVERADTPEIIKRKYEDQTAKDPVDGLRVSSKKTVHPHIWFPGVHYYNYFYKEATQGLDYYLICNIRNPYARLVSTWKHYNFIYVNGTKTTVSFIEFLQRMHREKLLNQKNCSGDGGFYCVVNEMDRVREESSGKTPNLFLRLENLKDDIKKIPFVNFNDPVINEKYLKHIVNNETKRGEVDQINNRKEKKLIINPNNIDPFLHWKDYYDQEAADIVYLYLEKDFKYFGYSKDSWKKEIAENATNPELFQT